MHRSLGGRRAPWITGLLALVAVAGCTSRAGIPAKIATGYISHVVCSYVFVSGLEPARVNEEDIAANPAFNGFPWALHHEVDKAKREVKAWTLGGIESRAVFRDALGCLRFGLLFLGDGVVGGRRILPEGWVRYSTAPTSNAAVGYGAGWWINQGDSRGAQFRREHGMPTDAFMALGIYGQTLVVVPSERLVIARFGTTYDLREALVDICRLTADTIAALRA